MCTNTHPNTLRSSNAYANIPTIIADQAFAEFIEATKGRIVPQLDLLGKTHLEAL